MYGYYTRKTEKKVSGAWEVCVNFGLDRLP